MSRSKHHPETSNAPQPITLPHFDNFTIGAIRQNIHAKFAASEAFTIQTLTNDLKMASLIPEGTSNTSVWRLIHSMGFRYKTIHKNTYVRKETLDTVCRRISALRELKRHREKGTQVVYLDETWFTTRMNQNMAWVDTTQPTTSATYTRNVPSGEGERFVILAAGTVKGFIEDSFLCFPTKSTTGDYHGEVNRDLFCRWLTSKLLPSLEEPSVLVIDNAPYHSQLTEESKCPTTSTKKEDLKKWLNHRNITFPSQSTRPELLQLCKKNRPTPIYEVDELVRSWGHEVVRLPPYHPELNAIEQIWGHMKHHVRSSLRKFTRADLRARLEEARLRVTREVWEGSVRRSQAFEAQYWATDNVHDPVNTIIINIDSDDEDDIFLDSDDE